MENALQPKPEKDEKPCPHTTHKDKKRNNHHPQTTHNKDKQVPLPIQKKKNPCRDGYLCKRQRYNDCYWGHTEQEIAYIAKSKFLFSLFIKHKQEKGDKEEKLILGTISKAEDDKHLFIPLNKEIIEKYPDLIFVVVKPTEIALSEQHYYKALYVDEQSKNGEFFVSIVEREQNLGKHNEERLILSTTQKETKNMKSCKDGYLCKRQRYNDCYWGHTQQEIAYIAKSKFLFALFIKHKQEKGDKEEKFMLGTVSKTEDDKHLFIPLNKEIVEKYPDLKFVVVKRTEIILSEQHYYEALYVDEQSKDGEFFVSIVEREQNWGKIGKEKDDVNALFYGHRPIYQEENEFTGDFKTGILREKFDGTIVLKCSESRKDYFFFDELHQNRALLGSTVHFLEIEGEHSTDRAFRQYKGAQVVSILRCPYSRDYIYGILEISSETENQINVSDLYSTHPQDINWNALAQFFENPNKSLIDCFTKPLITKKDFIEKHCTKLNSKPEDIDYLTQLIFKTNDNIENSLLKRIWVSLSELVCQRREISKLKTCFFKPLNKNLPTFQCLYIQDELKENPEIWRNYVKASYICWPASSKHPWVRIESTEGFIGDPGSDVRVILANNNVKTDKFPTKVQKQEEEIVKSWQKKIDESLKSLGKSDEKVFSIDGSRTKIRDDAFSVQKLSDCYEGCYRVGIHISDVTKIIKESSEIYKEAESRFHSCYVGKNFYKPMLPHKIQKNLSLKRDQWRYAFSIYIMINKDGVINLEKTEIKHSMIKPVANFTYKQVDEQFANPKKNVIQCEDEVKESLLLMRDLALKISERRENLGYKLDISEEDEEDCARNSQGHMLVEEFMLLANEIVTDYVEHQASSLESQILKARNEEKRIAREELEAEQEAKRKAKEEKQRQQELKKQEKEKKKKEREAKKEKEKSKQKKTVKKVVKKTVKKRIINENNEEVDVEDEIEEVVEEEVLELEEDHFEEEEEKESEDEDEDEEEEKEAISEDEEEMRVKRRGSEDEDESESEADTYALNIDIIEENSALSACRFLELLWKIIDKNKNLDLTDQKKYSESVKSILYDASIKVSIKDYVRYLLRTNDRKIKLVLKKNLKSKADVVQNDIKAGNASENKKVAQKNFKKKKGDKELKSKKEKKNSKLAKGDKTKKEEIDGPGIYNEDLSVKLSIGGQDGMKIEVIAENQESKASKIPKRIKAQKDKNFSKLPEEKKTQDEELEESKEDSSIKMGDIIKSIENNETNEKESRDDEINKDIKPTKNPKERILEKKAARRARKEKDPSELPKEKDSQNGELERPERNKEDCNVESPALVQNDIKMKDIIEAVVSNKTNEKDTAIEPSKNPEENNTKEEEKIKNEELDMIKLKKLESEFDLKLSENIIKRYYKLKDSQKMKFTSPIRRFHDVLVHYLIGDILEIEEKIKTIGKAIEVKLSEQEKAKEKPDGKSGKKKKKKKKKSKTKTRYEIFKELDSQLQGRIKGLAKKQKNIRVYYEENCDIREKGMDRAEREIEIMETCKTIISTNKSEITNALIVKIDNGEVRVFLLEYSFECALVNRYIFAYGRYPKVEMERGPPVEIHLFEDIKVQINIKKTFPLNFEVKFHSKLN